jgi:hypothetical protein
MTLKNYLIAVVIVFALYSLCVCGVSFIVCVALCAVFV